MQLLPFLSFVHTDSMKLLLFLLRSRFNSHTQIYTGAAATQRERQKIPSSVLLFFKQNTFWKFSTFDSIWFGFWFFYTIALSYFWCFSFIIKTRCCCGQHFFLVSVSPMRRYRLNTQNSTTTTKTNSTKAKKKKQQQQQELPWTFIFSKK